MAASSYRERSWKVRAQVALDELAAMADAAKVAHEAEAYERADAARRAAPARTEEPDQLRNAGPVAVALRTERLLAPPSTNGEVPSPDTASATGDPAFDRYLAYVTDQMATARDEYLPLTGWRRVPWRTSPVEGTWGHIHAANAGLVRVASQEQLHGMSPAMLALIANCLKEADTERQAVQWWFDQQPKLGKETPAPGPITPIDRGRLYTALAAAYKHIGAEYQRLRRFKWMTIGSAALALLVVGVLASLAWGNPARVPLCFPDPGNATTATTAAPAEPATASSTPAPTTATGPTTTTTAPTQRYVCPSSDAPAVTATPPVPHDEREDVAIVALFGLVGATFTCIPFLTRRAPPTSVPISSIRVAQAALKATLGMLCAIVGLLLLRAGIVPGFTAIDTRAQLIAYAIIFGASQHLVTRLIDARSNDLVKAVTAEDGDTATAAATA